MPTAQNPYNRRAFVARLVGATLFDQRTVARVLDGDARAHPSTVAAVRAAARRLGLVLPEPPAGRDLPPVAGGDLPPVAGGAAPPSTGASRRRGKGATQRHNARRRAVLAARHASPHQPPTANPEHTDR